MTQLRQEGWIHHLARHAVACFLTRGDLWISWEEGMKVMKTFKKCIIFVDQILFQVFEELLLDADWSVNAGMWMWLSCSSFFQQFFHCYCPVKFGRKADPNGDYIRYLFINSKRLLLELFKVAVLYGYRSISLKGGIVIGEIRHRNKLSLKVLIIIVSHL